MGIAGRAPMERRSPGVVHGPKLAWGPDAGAAQSSIGRLFPRSKLVGVTTVE